MLFAILALPAVAGFAADKPNVLFIAVDDLNEWTNLANRPETADARAELAKWLPKEDVAPVAGEKSRD